METERCGREAPQTSKGGQFRANYAWWIDWWSQIFKLRFSFFSTKQGSRDEILGIREGLPKGFGVEESIGSVSCSDRTNPFARSGRDIWDTMTTTTKMLMEVSTVRSDIHFGRMRFTSFQPRSLVIEYRSVLRIICHRSACRSKALIERDS